MTVLFRFHDYLSVLQASRREIVFRCNRLSSGKPLIIGPKLGVES